MKEQQSNVSISYISHWLTFVNFSYSAIATFNSGPPGGLTIPPSSARLSDIAGGIFGPGASVASTGINSQRSAIKAALSKAAGETWEDVLEYYVVSFFVFSSPFSSVVHQNILV